MQKMITLNQLVELAIATEQNNELPWEKISISQESAYSMMAAHVIDMFEDTEAADRETIMMSVMVKLLVENFILQLVIRDKNS